MKALKEISYERECRIIEDRIELLQSFMFSFISRHQDNCAAVVLKGILLKTNTPVNRNLPWEMKHKIASAKFMKMDEFRLNFVRRHMGDHGIELMKQEEYKTMKVKHAVIIKAMTSDAAYHAPEMVYG